MRRFLILAMLAVPGMSQAEVLECLFVGACVPARQTCHAEHKWSVRLHLTGPENEVIQHRARSGPTFKEFYENKLPAIVRSGDFVTTVMRVNGAGQADVYSLFRATGAATFMRSSLSSDSDVSSMYTGHCKRVP